MPLPLILGPILGAAVGGAINAGTSFLGLQKQAQMANDDRRENYMYGEAAADNAQQRQWETLDKYYTPQAQLRMLKEAGLSPSLMYGGSGSVGTTSAPQGSGAAGPQTQWTPLNIMQGAQLAQILADAKLKSAQANTENGDNQRGAVEIKAQEIENGLNQFELDFKNATQEDAMKLLKEQVENMNAQTQNILIDTKGLNLEYDFNSETYQKRIEEVNKRVENIATDTLAKLAGKKLTEEQTKLVQKQVNNFEKEFELKWESTLREIRVKEKEADIKETLAEFEKTFKPMELFAKLDQELEINGIKIDQEKREMWVNAVVSTLKTIATCAAVVATKGQGADALEKMTNNVPKTGSTYTYTRSSTK